MLPNADPASVVDGIGNRARRASDRGLSEALRAEVPARLQAVDEDVFLLRCIHDRRHSIREVTDRVVPLSGEFPVPRNRVGRLTDALYQRPKVVVIREYRVHHVSGVESMCSLHNSPIAGPRIDLYLKK